MPKAPTLDSTRITQDPLSFGRIRTQSLVSNQPAQRVDKAADELNKFVQKVEKDELKKANDLALTEADARLSNLETDTLYDPATGAMSKRGKQSFDLQNTAMEDFDAKAAEIEEGLSNDYQRASYQRMLAKRRAYVDRQINRHVTNETKTYDDNVTKSYVANEMNAAIENAHDPDRVAMSLDRQRGAIQAHADRNGMDQETTQRLMEESVSKTHKAVFSKIINSGGVTAAQEYYKQYKDDITGKDRVAIDKALKEGIVSRDSQEASDKIFAKHSDNMKTALEKAREIKDPEKRDETVRRVKSRFADLKIAEEAANREAFNSAYEVLEANGGNVDAIPRSLWAEMDPGKKEKLKKIGRNFKYGTDETDWNTFYNLKMMGENPMTRNKFKRLNLTEYFHKLSDSEKKTLINLQSEAKAGNENNLDQLQTDTQIVNGILQSAGIPYGQSATPDDNRRANGFRMQVEKLMNQKSQATGRKLTNQEVAEIANGLMTEVVTQRGWFTDTTKPRFELKKEDIQQITIDDVPAEDSQAIKEYLRYKQIPVSDDKIVDIYRRWAVGE